MPTPEREIDVSLDLAHRLLSDQCPSASGRSPVIAGEGWDNLMIRLGDDRVMRLPRRSVADQLLRNEQRWLPTFKTHSPIRLPVPVWNGSPTDYYPYAWSVVPWFAGSPASQDKLLSNQAGAVGAFLRNLHVEAPFDAPENPFRDQPLTAYAERVEHRLTIAEATSLDIGVDVETLRMVWQDLCDAPIDLPRTWVHGDLHPNNVVSKGGNVVAIIDWGDMTSGDAAIDLSAVWSLFETRAHDSFWSTYGYPSDLTLRRSRAWAIHFALLWVVDAADTDPSFGVIGRRTLARLVS